MICLQTGGGKTVCALYIASQLKVKTLIVVHNTFLKDQWEDRIKAFLPGVTIGHLQGETADVEGKDIVIAMIQSISMKEYPKEVFRGFGLTVIDECHHIASEVFVQAFQKITSKHMLGLSATPDRKDGLMYVIEWFLGPILYRSESGDKVDEAVHVEMFKHEPTDVEFNRMLYNNQGVMNVAGMVNKLAEFVPRTDMLVKIINDILDQDPGRQLLVLSDRVQHCKDICAKLNPEIAAILSQDVAASKRAEFCASKRVLIATYSMCKEGFDVATLNTLVMATPRPDIDQIVGRIMRTERSARTVHPLIVDIVDSTFRRQFQARLKLYRDRNYVVDEMEI
jgi:superfamily II DNA or RNA helicase